MNGAFYIGATGLEAQQRALDVLAHNITNMNTSTFKRSTVQFVELVTPAATGSDVSNSGVANSGGDLIAGLSGVRSAAANTVWTLGDLKATGSSSDIAINGNGFIEVQGSDGQLKLWRGGTLKVNADGFLATSDGLPLRSMISVPATATNLTIASDGTVTAVTATGESATKLGQIELANVANPEQLQPLGGGYFDNPNGDSVMAMTPGQEGSGQLVQGSLEGSNVNLADQMVELLLVQRAYGASAQLVQAGDQVMSILNNLRK